MRTYPPRNRSFRGFRGAGAAIAILVVCAVLASLLEPPDEPLAGRIVVSDGDSFHYGSGRVRLLGIDAPELSQTCHKADDALWPCGHAARTRLGALLAAKVDCARDGRDRYGRDLATCRSDGRDIGAIMVSEGLAISYNDYPREEAAARAARRGIWVGPFENPRSWRDDNSGVRPLAGEIRIWGIRFKYERLLRCLGLCAR